MDNVVKINSNEKDVDKEVEEIEDDGQELTEDDVQQVDHPIDTLSTTVIDIQSQIKRLKSKNPHNLKSELLFNLYPIILKGFLSILEYLEYLENPDVEEVDDEDYEKIEKELNENLKKAMEMNESLISLDESVSKKLKGNDKKKWDEIVSWVKSQIEKKGDENAESDK